MLKIKLILLVAGIIILLSGCYEIDFFSIELREDMSSTIQLIAVAPEGTDDPENFQSYRKALEKCGFETKDNFHSSRRIAFSGRQDFQTKTDLELGMNCDLLTNFAIKVHSPIVKEGILSKTFQLQLEILANNPLMPFQFPFREIRITLPGKINTSIENFPDHIQVTSSVSGTGTAILNFTNLNDTDDDFPLGLTESAYITARSYKSKIEIEWLLTTILGLLTFILGSGVIQYFSRKHKHDENKQL